MPASAPDYNKIASFYDEVIGSDLFGELIKNYLKKNYFKGSKVLELGCGTGINLLPLTPYFEIEGIDISGKMLNIAKKKLPRSVFYKQNITRFSVKKKYDAVLCLYDTINHIKGLTTWRKIFKNVKVHLNDGGVFIFDINTISKLDLLCEQPAAVIKFGRNYLIMNVTRESSKSEENVFNWNMKIFNSIGKDKFSFTENNIKEYSYEVSDIRKELLNYFKSVKTYNSDFKPARQNTGRVFFICKHF